jgi:hypothetical protein
VQLLISTFRRIPEKDVLPGTARYHVSQETHPQPGSPPRTS